MRRVCDCGGTKEGGREVVQDDGGGQVPGRSVTSIRGSGVLTFYCTVPHCVWCRDGTRATFGCNLWVQRSHMALTKQGEAMAAPHARTHALRDTSSSRRS